MELKTVLLYVLSFYNSEKTSKSKQQQSNSKLLKLIETSLTNITYLQIKNLDIHCSKIINFYQTNKQNLRINYICKRKSCLED